MHPGSWKQHPKHHHQQWAPFTFVFAIFPYIITFYLLSIAMLSIFGNPYCTVKALPNIITNSEYHPLFFALKLPIFYSYFSFGKAPSSRFGSAHGPWKHPMALPKWLQQVQRNNKFFAGTRTPDTPSDQKNILLPLLFHKIYFKAIPAEKYISKVWQWHFRVQSPKIYPYCIAVPTYILQVWHRHHNFCVTYHGPCVKNIF